MNNRRWGYAAALTAIAVSVALIVRVATLPAPKRHEVPLAEVSVQVQRPPVLRVYFGYVAKPPQMGLAGVGTGEHTGSCAMLRALGVKHAYNWASKPYWNVAECPEIEYVPMAWGGYDTGWEARAVERDWLAGHPTSYVLILNEPNDHYQANLTCEEAGQSVELYANDIWADFPDARLVIGGILVGDYETRNVSAALAYAECMLDNVSPEVARAITGWHFHFYPFYSSDPAISKAAITQLAGWTQAQGKQFWLSEVGLIGWAAAWPDAVKEVWMQDMVAWLSETPDYGEAPVVDRWNWFIAQRDPIWPCPNALLLYDDAGQMTMWGEIFAGRGE